MDRKLFLGLTAVAALSLTVVSIWVFYPGLMTYDSFRQYEQALSGQFDDRHPPALSLLWRVLNKFSPGPQSILLVVQMLYWLSWLLLTWWCFKISRSARRSIPLLFVGAVPIIYAFSGTIWKDVVLGVSWLLCAALLLNASDRSAAPITRFAGVILSVVLLVFGSMLRYNSLPAAVPLALGACLVVLERQRDRVIASFLLIGALITAPPALNALLDATATHPFTQLVVFDLAGISVQTEQNYLNPHLGWQPLIFDCYSPRTWETFAYGSCKLLAQGVYAASERGDSYIMDWAKTLFHEPIAYIRHRSWYFANLLRFGCVECKQYMWATHTDPDPLGFAHRPNFVFRGLLFVARKLGSSLLGKPYFWLVASIALALYHRYQDRSHSAILALVSLSGAAYLISYVIAGIADDFRYAYWTMLAVILCTAVPLSVADRPLGELWRLGVTLLPPVLIARGCDILLKSLSPID